ncbi:MAG: exodeoxyribonuclease VII large subunit [Phycisphaerales bacterium]
MTGRLPFNPSNLPPRDIGQPARRERAKHGMAAQARDGLPRPDHASSPTSDIPHSPSDIPPLTITQLTDLIKSTLADHTPAPLRVIGEISNFSERGHWYLSLKDEQNVLNCVMWAGAARKIRFTPQRGMQVVVVGRLDYYGPQSKLQLYIDNLTPVGAGALELQFRQLCDELRQLGYFDESRKKPLPVFPQRIAVVTAKQGAAIADVVRTARNRWPGIEIFLVNVRVQGADAAPEIAAAIDTLGTHHSRWAIDAVILTRGGGSIEDLWAFNERIVADAIFRCPLPIVAAIGHEVDTTIAELVADRRASTPTQAAEILVPAAAAEHQHIAQLQHRLLLSLRRHAERSASQLDAIARHDIFRKPAARLDDLRRDLRDHEQTLANVLRHRLARHHTQLHESQMRLVRHEPAVRLRFAQQQLVSLSRQLESVGPRSVLKRGYTYTTDFRGRLIRSIAAVRPGDHMTTHVADGQINSRVLGESTSQTQHNLFD